ncbi:hypothetical protein ACLI4R_03890 [Natrialbaceae archaeon A-chndr2]
MTPRTHSGRASDHIRGTNRQRETDSSQSARLRPKTSVVPTLADRVERLERQHRRLANTVAALARHAGISVGPPCTACGDCYLLFEHGRLRCPACGRVEIP